MNSNSVIRIRIVLALVCLWALGIGAKLYYVQIIKGDEYVRQADVQYIKPTAAVAQRGSIFFESKDGSKMSAAIMKDGYTLIMDPVLLTDPTSAYDALAQYIPLDRNSFFAKSAKAAQADRYEELAKKMDRNLGITIGELQIPGINLIKDSWRVYPGGTLSAHTIGLVGYDASNEVAGRYGLERYYQNTLAHSRGGLNVNFFAELFADIKNTVFQTGDKQGDIVATIDPTVENELEKTLEKTQAQWKSDSIGGIIMDPSTGSLYAMALRPGFDPNNTKDVADARVFSNPLVENVYEMGSIIKPLTMAAGIDSGAVTLQTTYDDTGFMLLNGKRIANFDGKARGVVSMQEVLSQSLNVGAATVALKVGAENFSKYFLSFGLGSVTGIDQPNEQAGIVDNLKSGREIELATASYGQGIAMSPIATTRALAILANGGVMVRPHIVSELDYADGSIRKITGGGERVLEKATADTVTKMLVKVVDDAISKAHPTIKMEHYSIAAKTGTAQIADHANGGYYTDRYLHSFFGYFPATKPRFIIFLYHYWPKGAEYASQTLTDPFAELAKFLINYYQIPPDR